MAEEKKEDRAIILTDVMLRYHDLSEAVATIKDGKKKFRVTVINDETSSKYAANKEKVRDATAKAEVDGGLKVGQVQKVSDPKRRFYVDGNTYVDDDDNIIDGFEGEGAWVIKASLEDQPNIWDKDKEDVDQDRIDKLFTLGCRVDVKIWPYVVTAEDKGGRGGFWNLNVVRFRKKSDRVFAAGRPEDSKDDFEDIEDDEDDDML